MNTLIVISLLFGIILMLLGESDAVKKRIIENTDKNIKQEDKQISLYEINKVINKYQVNILRYGFILFIIGFVALLYKIID